MYKQDNEKHYTWNPKWHQKYESIWGVWEKFRYVNVPDKLMNALIGYTKSSKEYSFNKDLFCFQKAKRDITPILRKYLNKDIIKHDFLRNRVHNLHLLFYDNLKYCPECIKYGYHSYYHQLKFLDNCFIHNECRLTALCDCKYGYSMRYRFSKVEAFQCMKCFKKPENLPLALDGIAINWNMPIKFKVKTIAQNLQRILLIDAGYELTGIKNEFTNNQKACLKNIFINRKIEECKPILTINKPIDRVSIYNFSEILQKEIFDKYGFDYCKKQFQYVQRFYTAEKTEEVNPEVIALFYVLKELRLENHVDHIYPVNFGELKDNADNKYNQYMNISCRWRMYYCRYYYSYLESQPTRWINIATNYIYDYIVRCRYKEIVEYFKAIDGIDYFSEHVIPHKKENYPVILMVDYYRTMDNKVEIYF